ncbi:podocalyxin [Anoplopoma fimbria]|uniref:podocalyxin n=1 Tax=Anoplopoma fimbria TaxID=229290 RepID=UPI0023EAA3D9|nr:podocalyxin [Anoplopoma fimbria]
MRATMRITRLLLSLSFLFLSVCSNADTQTAGTGGGASGTVQPTKIDTVTVAGAQQSGVTKPTPAPTSTKPAAAATMIAMTTKAKPTDSSNPAQSQAPTGTKNTPTPAIISSVTVANKATTAATAAAIGTPSPLTTVTPAQSSSALAVTPSATTMKMANDNITSKTSGLPSNVGTTEMTKVSTAAPPLRQQSTTHTTITTITTNTNNTTNTNTTNASQDSQGGAEKTTVTATGSNQIKPRATEPSGNKVTTNTLSTLTKAGAHVPQTFGTKAGPIPPQTATTTTTTITTTSRTSSTTTAAQPNTFLYSLNGHEKKEEKDLVEVCRRLMVNFQDGNCTLKWQNYNGKMFDYVKINGKMKASLANQYYEEITKEPTGNKTLIAILASCGALLIMIVILAVCASHHRKPYNENQQHLTEELHTVENGYHDNPTLEVMEVQPEMQEKKTALNGEFNDSWIVPIDNLLKEDIADEEDTHL